MRSNESPAKKATFGAMVSALCLLFLFGGAVFPSGKIALFALSIVCASLPSYENMRRTSILVYFIVSIAGMLILPGGFIAIAPFIAFGHYGIFRKFIQRKLGLRKMPMLIAKLAYLDVFAAIACVCAVFLLGVDLNAISPFPFGLIVLAAQPVFIVFDYAFGLCLEMYRAYIRSALFHDR